MQTYVFADVGCLCQLETALAGTLAVVLDIEVVGDCDTVALLGRAHARERRLHDSVLETEAAQLQRAEERRVSEGLEAGGRGVCFGHAGEGSGNGYMGIGTAREGLWDEAEKTEEDGVFHFCETRVLLLYLR
jgi:hypothetical protein